jgi:hypothetical protein
MVTKAGNSEDSEPSGAKKGAFDTQLLAAQPDLVEVITAWPVLTEPMRSGILALVRAAEKD